MMLLGPESNPSGCLLQLYFKYILQPLIKVVLILWVATPSATVSIPKTFTFRFISVAK